MNSGAIAAAIGEHPRVKPLLTALNVNWTETQFATTVNRLLYREQIGKHPLLVLMVLEFTGATIDDLLGTVDAVAYHSESTADGQMGLPINRSPCANRACTRFVGSPAQLFRDADWQGKFVITCPACGFSYRWVSLRPGAITVLSSAPSWDAALARLLSDPKVSVRQTSRELGVSSLVVLRNARRLGIWRSDWADSPRRRLRDQERAERLSSKHRAAWLGFTKAQERVPIRQAPRDAFNAYRYLIRHDREWLASIPGPPRPRRSRSVPKGGQGLIVT